MEETGKGRLSYKERSSAFLLIWKGRKKEHARNRVEVKKRKDTVVISNIHPLNIGLEMLLKLQTMKIHTVKLYQYSVIT